jgi:hypothetical protein
MLMRGSSFDTARKIMQPQLKGVTMAKQTSLFKHDAANAYLNLAKTKVLGGGSKPPSTPSPVTAIAIPSSGLSVPRGKCQVIDPSQGSGFEMVQLGMVVPKHINGTFRVKFCPSKKSVLQGKFVVQRLHDCNLEKSFLYDKAIEGELRDRFGPDELTLELEGPEFVWLEQKHVGSCKYHFAYRVETPGLYRLVGYSYRGGYESLNEKQEPEYYFPPIQYDNLVGDSVWIDLNHREGDISAEITHKKKRLKCTKLNSPGRWVHKTGINIFKNATVQHKARPRGTGRGWAINPREYRWSPYDCYLESFTNSQAGDCLSNRGIQFRGDSHTRILFNHLMSFSCGVVPGEMCFSGKSESEHAPCRASKVSALPMQMCLQASAKCHNDHCALLYIVLGSQIHSHAEVEKSLLCRF